MNKTITMLGCVLAITAISVGQTLPEAKQLIEHQRFQSAKTALQSIIKAEPANAEAWYYLSQAYLPLQQAAIFKDSLALAPVTAQQDAWYKVSRGQWLLQNNQPDSAQWYFNQAIGDGRKKDPAILLAVANAWVSEKNGDANRALMVLEQAGKKDKDDPAFNVMRGNAYRKLSNGSEAYKAYQTALNANGNQPEALYQMGKIFLTQKNSDAYLNYFKKAVAADPLYSPAWYELYYDAYYKDPIQALSYYRNYLAASDPTAENKYQLIDLLYINKKYDSAITKAQDALAGLPENSMPRLQKLMAYSYAELKDTANALSLMNSYFTHEKDTNLVAKDYELMANLYNATEGKEDSALIFYQAAVNKITDSTLLFTYYKKLADLYKDRKDMAGQANWLGKYYTNNPKGTNIDLFNWGIAHVKAEQYEQADTVFGQYIQKYPEQAFGYYWRARANSLRDSAMEKGIAIPHYHKLVEILQKDTTSATNKKWLVESYGYIAAYETNEEKDYETALENLHKILEIDPANKDAQQYVAVLEKKLDADSKEAAPGNK
jgi:tetratricopeptide (TPR) repeat protein